MSRANKLPTKNKQTAQFEIDLSAPSLEEKIALHKEGLEEFAEYLKKLGADSKSSRYFKVGDVLKKTF